MPCRELREANLGISRSGWDGSSGWFGLSRLSRLFHAAGLLGSRKDRLGSDPMFDILDGPGDQGEWLRVG